MYNGDGTVALMFFQRLKNETGQLDTFAGNAKQDGTDGKLTIKFDTLFYPVPCE